MTSSCAGATATLRSLQALMYAVCVSFSSGQLQTGAPWPARGHDSAHTGRSPVGSSPSGWSFTAGGEVFSSPAIGHDGTVYVGSWDRKLYALKGSTGALLWSNSTGNWITSSPAIGHDGTVYVGSLDSKVYAFNGLTGALIWSYTTGGSIYYSSPAIGQDGTVYVGSNDCKLYALNGSTGALIWSYTTGNMVSSSPALGRDGNVFVGSWDSVVYALHGSTGALVWRYTTGGSISSSPAIASDGTIYIGSDDFKVHALSGSSGALFWSFMTGSYVQSSPAIGPDGTVYVGSDDGKVYALQSSIWSFATENRVGSSPAIGLDGTVYVGSWDHRVYAFHGLTGALIWNYTTGGLVFSSPAIASDGTLYIGSANFMVYALKPPAPVRSQSCTPTATSSVPPSATPSLSPSLSLVVSPRESTSRSASWSPSAALPRYTMSQSPSPAAPLPPPPVTSDSAAPPPVSTGVAVGLTVAVLAVSCLGGALLWKRCRRKALTPAESLFDGSAGSRGPSTSPAPLPSFVVWPSTYSMLPQSRGRYAALGAQGLEAPPTEGSASRGAAEGKGSNEGKLESLMPGVDTTDAFAATDEAAAIEMVLIARPPAAATAATPHGAVSTPPPPRLRSEPSLSVADFEQHWRTLPTCERWESTLQCAPLDRDGALAAHLAPAHLRCLASGTVAGVVKAYFYAHGDDDPIGCSSLCIAEVSVTLASLRLGVVVRASSPALGELCASAIRAASGPLTSA